MNSEVHDAFKRFLPPPGKSAPVTSSTEPNAVTAALSFDDPTVCQYCGKPFDKTKVGGDEVLVCWEDRNVVVPFQK